MGLFVLIQFRRFNNRHDERLNQRLLANEKQTILELYKDFSESTDSVTRMIYL